MTPFQSESIAQIAPAYIKAYAQIRNPEKNREVAVETARGGYQFSYATLDRILDDVREPLSENGLAIIGGMQDDDEGVPVLQVRLLHESGEWFGCYCNIVVDRPGPQALGSALTYLKRYAVTSLLALSPTEDDDGNAAEGNRPTDITKATPPPPNGTTTAKELHSGYWDEAFQRDSLTIKYAEGEYQKFTHWMIEGIQHSPDTLTLQKLWADNQSTLDSPDYGKRLWNRVNKAFVAREVELKETGEKDAANG